MDAGMRVSDTAKSKYEAFIAQVADLSLDECLQRVGPLIHSHNLHGLASMVAVGARDDKSKLLLAAALLLIRYDSNRLEDIVETNKKNCKKNCKKAIDGSHRKILGELASEVEYVESLRDKWEEEKKQLKTENEALKAENKELNKRMEMMEERMAKLEKRMSTSSLAL